VSSRAGSRRAESGEGLDAGFSLILHGIEKIPGCLTRVDEHLSFLDQERFVTNRFQPDLRSRVLQFEHGPGLQPVAFSECLWNENTPKLVDGGLNVHVAIIRCQLPIEKPRSCGTLARMEPANARPARLFLWVVGMFLGAAALLPEPAEAKIREPRDLGELARDADVIVIGRVRAVIPSLFSLPGVVVVVAAAVCAGSVLRWRQVRIPPVVRDGMLLSIMVILFGGLLMATTRFHRRIAIVHVDRLVSGSSNSWVPVWFASNFACDATRLEAGSRYLLFLEDNVIGYRMSWYDLSAWKETPAGGFHCWRGPGSEETHVEEDVVRELQRLRS
jgi:hypothetical protein